MPTNAFRRELAVASDPGRCWQVLTDVPRLVSWVSIVEDATEIAALAQYRAVLADRIGPFSLRADLAIDVSDVDEPRRIRVRAQGEDRQVGSRIRVDATLRLSETSRNGTTISVDGMYEVTGRVATMGAGMITKKADTILAEFFSNAAAELGGMG